CAIVGSSAPVSATSGCGRLPTLRLDGRTWYMSLGGADWVDFEYFPPKLITTPDQLDYYPL
ncbi:MAG: hypothetical protein QGM45_12045, partial [Anaerolineales bacterium]|nr:hypothetical protein [Anaerolineales bacterium]